MPLGSRRRGTAPRFVLPMVALLSGCQGFPAARPGSALPGGLDPAAAAAPAAPSASDPASLMPGAEAAATPPIIAPEPDARPTPLLDAASVRAEARKRAIQDPGPARRPPPAPTEPPGPAEIGAEVRAVPPDPAPLAAGSLPAVAVPEEIRPEPIQGGTPVAAPLEIAVRVEPAAPADPNSAAEPPASATTAPAPAIVVGPQPTSVDRWREGLEQLRALAVERAREGGEPAEVWARREHWLDLLAGGKEPEAVMPPSPAEPAGDAPAEPEPEPEEDSAPEITDLRLCRRVHGFGSYEAIDPPTVGVGQAVILYWEVSGLRYVWERDQYRSRLITRLEVLPEGGGEPLWSQALGTTEDACRRPRRDYFANIRLTLPATLSPGSYQIRLIQEDAVAERTASGSLTFTIRP